MEVQVFLSVGGIVLGFVLATAREAWRHRRDTARREKAVLAAVREELLANQQLLRNNQALLSTELEDLKRGQRSLNPLDPLEGGFWDLVKIEMPRAIANDPRMLSSVRTMARLTGQVNQMLRTRESFKTLSPTLTMRSLTYGGPSWVHPLRGYDELLIRFQWELLGETADLLPAIDALLGAPMLMPAEQEQQDAPLVERQDSSS